MKSKRIILSVVLIVLSIVSFSQNVLKLDKDIRLDTLRLWINYPTDFDDIEIAKYDSILNSTISRFNEQSSFLVKMDSVLTKNWILMDMEPIKYVDTKRNVLSTGLSIALIGGHVYFISAYGWTIPIWPILLPGTVSKVNFQIDNDMITSKPSTKTWISSNGYLMKKEKQVLKFEKKFDKDIFKFLKRIDNQNIKNNKL